MAITKASNIISIPINPQRYIGDTLDIINNAFETLTNEFNLIALDKIPNPTYLTYEPINSSTEPTSRGVAAPTHGQSLTLDPKTFTWKPSAVPGYEASIASAWVNFRAPTGFPQRELPPIRWENGDYVQTNEQDTLCTTVGEVQIISQYNVSEIKKSLGSTRGVYDIYFDKPLVDKIYAVFATGNVGGSSYASSVNKVPNINCKYIDEARCRVSWYPGELPYGSNISVVVFSLLGINQSS